MRFEKVILVNPPNPPGYVSNKDSMGGFGQMYPEGAPPFPPLDIPYLAAFLLERGRPTSVIECGALHLGTDALCEALARDPDLARALVVVRTSLPTIDWDLGVAADVARRAKPGALALSGPVVSALARRIETDRTIDFAVVGEPDHPVLELVEGRPLEEIAGLWFRTGERWTRNPERRFEDDLDKLPFPRWDLLPYDRYVIPKSSTAGRKRFLPMLTSRGCPFGCSYCPYPVGQGLKWRHRSPANVVDEMEHLVRDLGVEYILFRDPMFSMKEKRVVDLCDEIVRRGLRVRWKCETRVDYLAEDTVAAMARAGCDGINFGVESTDPEIQKGVHRKPIVTDEFVRKVALCRQHDIKTFAFFIVGLPGDTVETILRTIRFAVDVDPSWIQFTVSTPFAGTKLHEWAVGQGFVDEGFYKIVSAHEGSVGNENLTPAQIHGLHRFAQILQNNLINRHGILKDESRRSAPYRAAKRAADVLCHALASGLVDLGSWYFRRTIGSGRGAAAPVASAS